MTGFIVTENAMRPASSSRECFYCKQPVGQPHQPQCVLVRRTVRVRATIEYDINVPADWDAEMIEFHRNESSWCADNALTEIESLKGAHGCLCGLLQFDFLDVVSEPFLKES